MADRGPWFQTWSGRKFHPEDPRPEDIELGDVAHALAHQCRFAGHVRTHYSVAQHSVLVSQIVPCHLALHGLLHDAAEAYVGDLIEPMKRALRGDGEHSSFDLLEDRVHAAVAARFVLWPLDAADRAAVKHADLRALATERRDLLRDVGLVWDGCDNVAPVDESIDPMAPADAEALFLRRFSALVPTYAPSCVGHGSWYDARRPCPACRTASRRCAARGCTGPGPDVADQGPDPAQSVVIPCSVCGTTLGGSS